MQQQVENYIQFCKNVRLMTEATIKTKTEFLYIFTKTIGCNRLEDLTNEIYSEFMVKLLERGLSERSVNNYTSQVLAMVRFYREMGLAIPLKTPLVPKLKEKPPRHDFYSYDVIKKVIDNCDEVQSLMISICFDTGMRINELRNLQIKDFAGNRVSFIGKGRIYHESYIRKDTLRKLKNYIKEYEVSSYLWAERNSEKPLSYNSISRIMRKAFISNGIDNFHPHALRHSFATDLQKRGATVVEIQKMIGHSNASITERYLHEFDSIEPLFAKYH